MNKRSRPSFEAYHPYKVQLFNEAVQRSQRAMINMCTSRLGYDDCVTVSLQIISDWRNLEVEWVALMSHDTMESHSAQRWIFCLADLSAVVGAYDKQERQLQN